MDDIDIFETQEGVFLTHFKDNELWRMTLTDFSDDMRPGDVFKGHVQRLEGRRVWIDLGFSKAALLKHKSNLHHSMAVGQCIDVVVDRVQTSGKGAQVHLDAHPVTSKNISKSNLGKAYASFEEWLSYIQSLNGLQLKTNSVRILHLIQKFANNHKIILKSDMKPSEHVFEAWNIQQETCINIEGEGSILIEEVETLTAIDVNTRNSSFSSKDLNYDHHWLSFNQKCARVIMQQIQLRQLGGMIIIDFPRLEKREHQKILFQTVQQWADAKTQVLGFTRGGLFELTRAKSQSSVTQRLRRKPLWQSFLNLMPRD